MSKINHSIVNFCEGISSGRISEWYCRVYLYVGSLGNKGQMVGMANVLEIFRGSHKLRNCISNFKFQELSGSIQTEKDSLIYSPSLCLSLSLPFLSLSHLHTPTLFPFLFLFKCWLSKRPCTLSLSFSTHSTCQDPHHMNHKVHPHSRLYCELWHHTWAIFNFYIFFFLVIKYIFV